MEVFGLDRIIASHPQVRPIQPRTLLGLCFVVVLNDAQPVTGAGYFDGLHRGEGTDRGTETVRGDAGEDHT